MRIRHAIVALSLAVGLAGCGGNKTVGFRASPRAVTLEVEVYDPDTNLVWEGVSVRIVEAEHEWSGVIVENPIADDWFLTSNTGTVYYSARDLAETSIGFLESDRGDAIIEPERDADEAGAAAVVDDRGRAIGQHRREPSGGLGRRDVAVCVDQIVLVRRGPLVVDRLRRLAVVEEGDLLERPLAGVLHDGDGSRRRQRLSPKATSLTVIAIDVGPNAVRTSSPRASDSTKSRPRSSAFDRSLTPASAVGVVGGVVAGEPALERLVGVGRPVGADFELADWQDDLVDEGMEPHTIGDFDIDDTDLEAWEETLEAWSAALEAWEMALEAFEEGL